MATGLLDNSEEDCVPLVSSDEEVLDEEVVQKAKMKEDEAVIIKNRKASEDDQVKARAVLDYSPKGDDEIELKRGEFIEYYIFAARSFWLMLLSLNCSPLGR